MKNPNAQGDRIEVVVLDWAGTTVDFGCMAPVGVFVALFRSHGVEISLAQAREPMGTHKREHIRRVCAMPSVAAAWTSIHGAPPDEATVDALYAEAAPLQIACLPDHATPIPGVLEAVATLRARGIKIGSTTGYNREMLNVLEVHAAAAGYAPDVAVAASEVGAGRPAPDLCWTAAMRLGLSRASAAVKVGDTPVDIAAGRAAGFWTVAVACGGNQIGLTLAEWEALDPGSREQLRAEARRALADAGAHLVIDWLSELPAAIDTIEAALARGERP